MASSSLKLVRPYDVELKGRLNEYHTQLDHLSQLRGGRLPSDIHCFDIRFRLTCSLNVSFDATSSYTKSLETRKTYQALLMLNDSWFAYESCFELCKARKITKASPTKSEPFTLDVIRQLGLEKIAENLYNRYEEDILMSEKRRSDYFDYLGHLHSLAKTKTQQALLQSLHDEASAASCPKFSHWLGLVYAIRNAYVHNADTAKSGVKYYSTKIAVLNLSRSFMIRTMLELAIACLCHDQGSSVLVDRGNPRLE